MSDGLFFNTYDIFSVIRNQTEQLKHRIHTIPGKTILGASEQDLIASLLEEFRLKVPTLKEADIYITHAGETQVDVSHDPMRRLYYGPHAGPIHVPGNETVIAVPFEGDAEFFKVQPQTYSLNPPRGTVTDNEIHLTYVRTDQNAEALKQDYQRAVSSIKENLSSLTGSANQFNSQLEASIASQLKARKDRLLADAGMTAALGLPLKKRESSPTTYSVPVKRRTPKIEEISVTNAFTPEPSLAMEDYLEILRIIQNMVQVMELSPRAFHDMGEEDLRSQILVQLNGAFNGQATGETFNFQGKTDILIRVEGKNVFIAECKFWEGEKGFLATLDQLLSYLSWRDTKVAVVVFNRNSDFSAVLARISDVTPRHPHFKRDLRKSSESVFRYVFAQPNDRNREVFLTVLAFDVPTQRKSQPEK